MSKYGVIELGDWPGGSISYMDCAFPETIDGGGDLALPFQCEIHGRTIWWCLNRSVLWCDGGPPHWEWHAMWIVSRPHLEGNTATERRSE